MLPYKTIYIIQIWWQPIDKTKSSTALAYWSANTNPWSVLGRGKQHTNMNNETQRVSVNCTEHTRWTGSLYWVVQVGLLTPLTFALHRLSSLAAFTSCAYFLHNGRQWLWICKFYTANFKDIFGGPPSECVITCRSCYRMPQNAFFSRSHDLQVSQKTMQRHFSSNLHPLSQVIFATAVLAFVLLHNFHCYTHCEATPTQKSARKWRRDLSWLLARKITKGIHLCKPASLNHQIDLVMCMDLWTALDISGTSFVSFCCYGLDMFSSLLSYSIQLPV